MSNETLILLLSAASIGLVHTIAGPDHYIPFIALAKARKWSNFKTIFVVTSCGIGHILSSVLIAVLAIALGVGISDVSGLEGIRGNIAGWLLIAFGLVYMIWGIRKSVKSKSHSHPHEHSTGESHNHNHSHFVEHSHVHDENHKSLAPWLLFLIFIFGPCEPLIPLVMYPAVAGNYFITALLVFVFAIVTIIAMLAITMLGLYGINLLPLKKLEKNVHAIAGATVLVCGIGIIFLGL